MPSVATSPSPIANFVITTFFETVMFSFDALNDIDLDSYAYRLYDNALGTGTPVAQGRNKSNVFTVSVQNTTDSTPRRYWGQVAAVNSAGVVATYTPLQSDQATPQIGSQYIATLTADKIRAGTIGAYEIILNGSGSILKSSNYDPSVPIGSRQGWTIKGDGTAEFSSASIRGSISASSLYFNSNNRWGRNSGNTADSSEFKIGTNASYLFYDFANHKVTFTGELSAASGTFTGALSGGTIQIGSGENVFKADSNGIYLGNETFANAEFRVTPAGALTATNANITGAITATSGTFAGTVRGGDIYIGGASAASAPFKVDSAGNLTATSGTFSGALSGATGNIGDNFIIGNSLRVLNNVRLNYGESSPGVPIGADGGQTIVYIRSDTNDANPNNYPLRISNHNNSSPNLFRVRYDGQVYFNGAVQTSDVRLKNNILETNLGLNFINDLRPVSYFMSLTKEYSPLNNVRKYGLIAQEVKETYQKYTESFGGWSLENEADEDSLQVLSYTEFISPMIKAIQELSAKVDELESRLV